MICKKSGALISEPGNVKQFGIEPDDKQGHAVTIVLSSMP